MILNKNYYYKARAYKLVNGKKNYGSYSSVKTVNLHLGTPSFTLEGFEGQASVKINEVSYAEGYEIVRSTSKKGKYTKIGETNSLIYHDPITPNKTYYYKVRTYTTYKDKRIYSEYSGYKSINLR